MLSSRAMKVHLRQDSLESFLSQASEDLVEVDLIEFKDPFFGFEGVDIEHRI